MRVLFDQGPPAPLRATLIGHEVVTAFEQGWSTLKNGDLLSAAEERGFDILVTTDMNLRYQHNLAARRIGIVVLSTTSWPRIRAASLDVAAAVDRAVPGSYSEVPVP